MCDTTEFNLHNHKGRLKDFEGLGSTTNKDIIGFFNHAALAIDKNSFEKIGWAHINLFNRPVDKVPFTRCNSSVPIEEKESYKWQKACQESRDNVLDLASSVTYVMDREADIYELMATITEGSNFIIRARHNRKILDDNNKNVKLFDDIKSQKSKGIIEIEVKGESRNRKRRHAKCTLKYKKYKLPITSKVLNKKEYKQSIDVWVVRVEETAKSTPDGEEPISWTLITNKEILNNEEAIAIIAYYNKRWEIEEAFRLLKKQGFDIESTQLETGSRIRKWLLLGMEASIKVMQLKSARDGSTGLETKELFDPTEIECLELLNKDLEGATEKLQNQFQKENLAWACWIISRLGGWDGYMSQRPPGTITIKRGLDVFSQRVVMYKLIKNSS